MAEEDLDVAVDAVRARFRALLEEADPDQGLVEAVDRGRGLQVGGQVDSYRIVRELGSGGMGTVYLAERADGAFARNVALKILKGIPTEDGRRRFRVERQVLSELDHPGIARLFDGGETPSGQPYLVMEYVEGQDVLSRVAAARLTLAERLALWKQIALAVAHAHQRLVIHRDLKPSNVLVRADGQPKLIDFGIAKLVTEGEPGGDRSTRAFTPGYASPEQIAGRAITTRTDVYALGTLLSELLCGCRRAGGERTAPEIEPLILEPDLAAILEKAQAEDPEERYPTVESMLDDLERLSTGLPVRARRWTTRYRLKKALVRWRVPLLAGATLVGLGVMFVARLQLERDRAQAAEVRAEVARDRAEASARRAAAVVQYLTRTFEVAAPESTLGQTITLAQLLDQGEASLATVGPEDRAEVMASLADLRDAIGDPAAALRLSTTATGALGTPRDHESALRMLELEARRALFANNAGEPDALRRSADRMVALRDRFGLTEGRAQDSVDLVLGRAELVQGHLEEANRAISRVTSATISSGETERVYTALEALSMLTDAAIQARQGEAALSAARRFRALAEKLPPNHPRRHFGVFLEGFALAALDRHAEAVLLFRQAIAESERLLGPKNGQVAGHYDALANSLNMLGRFAEGQEAILRELEILRARGLGARQLTPALVNASSLVESAGDYARADALLKEAAFEVLTPAAQQFARLNRARLDALLGRFGPAREGLAKVLSSTTADEFTRLRSVYQLAQVELWAGRPEVARAHLATVEKAQVATRPEFGPLWRAVRRLRLQIAARAGDPQAVAPLRALVDEYAQIFGPESFDADLIRVDLADALANTGQGAEAKALLPACLARLAASVLPGEHNRAHAEHLAHRLGL
ncbi:MAG: serine/threonine-protein kinase [Myxococcota bacterium]